MELRFRVPVPLSGEWEEFVKNMRETSETNVPHSKYELLKPHEMRACVSGQWLKVKSVAPGLRWPAARVAGAVYG